jgi:hypothetical protein
MKDHGMKIVVMCGKVHHGKPCRVIRTSYAAEWQKDPSKIKTVPPAGADLAPEWRDELCRLGWRACGFRSHLHADRAGRRHDQRNPSRRGGIRRLD